MSKAIDLESYYCIPIDKRDLNYSNYIDKGEKKISKADDYNSHNTRRLDVGELKDMLLQLPYIQEILGSPKRG